MDSISPLVPQPSLDDDELLAALDTRGIPTLRVNFVSSIDGAATHRGLSGGLSGAGDKRQFELLRRLADVVLVGAGTVRKEGYEAMRVSDESVAWRVAHGLSEHPVFAIVSGSLNLDPASPIFTDAPVRPIVFTTAQAAGAEDFDADVVVAGEATVEPASLLAALRDRRLEQVLCEGGPSLFASLLDSDAVDELCITISPTLESGSARRIATGGGAVARSMRLVTALRSGDELLLRYARGR